MLHGTNLELRMETILHGHQNWVTASTWYFSSDGELELATCSMDKSVILWKIPNENDDVWQDYAHLGAVGGGNLGFLGVVSGKDDDGNLGILAYSYTGSFHLWWYSIEQMTWISAPAPSGHYDQVRDLEWSPNGAFLLSTSYDQTTRLFSKYQLQHGGEVWAELARPQVHGHCLRCLGVISACSFVSGAEEKVIRVFRNVLFFVM